MVSARNKQLESEYQSKMESLYKRLIDPKTKRISLSSNHMPLNGFDWKQNDSSQQTSTDENRENHKFNTETTPVDFSADTEFREMKQRLTITTEQNDLLRQTQVFKFVFNVTTDL